MPRTTKQHLLRLLHLALVDLRNEGYNKEDLVVFMLADLFHNIPLELDSADQGDITPEDILGWLRTRAHGTPMEAWLNLRMQEVIGHGWDT